MSAQSSSGDQLPLLLKRWPALVLCGALGTAAGIGYALLAPEWYEATLSVIQSQRGHESAALSLASTLPGAFDSMSTDVQRIEAVLTSHSVSDAVIDKFELDKRYESSHREITRERLWKHCSTSIDRKGGVVALTCEDRDPKFAAALAGYFGEIGNQVFARVSGSSAREEEKFLETQVKRAKQDVDDAAKKLRDFQEQHKIVDLPEQSKAVISAMASLKGEIVSKQLELSYLARFSSRTEASVAQLQQQIDILAAKLSQFEAESPSGKSTASAGSGAGSFFPGAMNLPELRLQLEQLIREQQVRDTVFNLLTQRYEMARVEAARDTSTFQILDQPTVPTFRSSPKRRQVATLGAGAGVGLGLAWMVLPVWLRRRRAATSDAQP